LARANVTRPAGMSCNEGMRYLSVGTDLRSSPGIHCLLLTSGWVPTAHRRSSLSTADVGGEGFFHHLL